MTNPQDAQEVRLPELDVTDEDRERSKQLFDGRPTSLVTTREMQDTLMLRAMAELFCRERQLAAVTEERDRLLKQMASAKEFIDDVIAQRI